MDSELSKVDLERDWLDKRMAGNSTWSHNRSAHRFYVYEGSQLVVWHAPDGINPVIDHGYIVDSIGLTTEAGITVRLVRHDRQDAIILGYVPQILPGTKVFLWTPGFSDVRFVPREYADASAPRRLTVPLCLKVPTNPMTKIKPGCFYVTERTAFLKQWGGHG